MKLIFWIVVLIIIIGLVAAFLVNNNTNNDLSEDISQPSDSINYVATVVDVTKGEDVRGINTGGNSLGTVNVSLFKGSYSLQATFENLPEPNGDDFYEGWIVRRGDNFNVISTGELKIEDGIYQNSFSSENDLTDHDFYVLTLEPNDGDPAPADHIVEGEIERI